MGKKLLEAARQFPGVKQLLKDIAKAEAKRAQAKPTKSKQQLLPYLGAAAFAVDGDSGMSWAVKYMLKYCLKNDQKLVIFSERIGTMDMIEHLLTSKVMPGSEGSCLLACPCLDIPGLAWGLLAETRPG